MCRLFRDLPHAYVLVLVVEVGAPVEVVGHDAARLRSEEVLRAALGGQVVVVAAVLGHLVTQIAEYKNSMLLCTYIVNY